MNRPIDDAAVELLRRTMDAVAVQVADAPPAFIAAPIAPTLVSRRPRVLLAAAACVLIVVIGAVVFALTRSTHHARTPAVEPPSQSTSPVTSSPPRLAHLVPGPTATITRVAIQGDADNPQPLEYQLGYSGTVDGQPAQLLITANDYSHTKVPEFSLQNQGCSADGSQSLQYSGTVLPIADHDACLVTNIQNAIHLGWIDTDRVSVLIQGSGLSVEQIEAVALQVERVPGDPLALRLTGEPPSGLKLAGEGRRPVADMIALEYQQDGCPYVLLTQSSAPAFDFNPWDPATIVRGNPGRIGGPATVFWTEGGSSLTLGIVTSELTADARCITPAAAAETLVPVDDAKWSDLLGTLTDKVQYTGGAVPSN